MSESSLDLSHSSNLERLQLEDQAVAPLPVQAYLDFCGKYGTEANPGVLVALRYKLPSLRPTSKFLCKDMLPLADTILMHPDLTDHIISVDLSHARIRSHGAIVLSRILASAHWESLELKANGIGGHGARAICSALKTNTNLKYLGLSRCIIGKGGAEAFAQLLASDAVDSMALETLDLSFNHSGLKGVIKIRATAAALSKPLTLVMDGNIVLAEVLSSVTHGVALILAIFGAFFMLGRASDLTPTHFWASVVYSFSLIILYACSTLFHSFFMLETTKRVFQILDQSAIYVLIAGSYTPVLTIVLNHKEIWSVYLLIFLWIVTIAGLFICSCYYGPWKGRISLFLYLMMGWTCVVCFPDILQNMSSAGISWLVAGGLCYTGGVPFYVLDSDPTTSMLHVVWHLFVMAGSATHWWMVFQHVLTKDIAQQSAGPTACTTDTSQFNLMATMSTLSTSLGLA